MEPGESGAKKRFGAELRAHRTRRGWTQVELGAKIGYSGSYVSDVERGDKGATDDFAKRCDSEDAFDLPGTFLRLWEDLQRESFPTWFAPVLPIQREATKITGWDNGAVPGLQQTEDYARALVKARRPHDDEESIERTVHGRMERQAILVRLNPPKLTHIIQEGALRHVIGGPEVMANQLDKLIKTGDAPGTVIQVLPYSAHDHAGVEGLLYLYERTGQPDVAYSECFGGARLIHDPAEISDLTTVMGMLRAAALSPRDSVALMRQIRRDLD